MPKTLESTREPDETIVLMDDEVMQDEKTDEFANYFERKVSPKLLITSFTRAHLVRREPYPNCIVVISREPTY